MKAVQFQREFFLSSSMNFCSHCGARVNLKVPPGDNLPRHVCERCEAIFYQNPRMVVGCIPEWEERILLCRRAIEPRYGLWTLPAGFMENGETAAQGAMREALEEACARVQTGEMFTFINVAHINQVHIMFRAKLLDLNFSAGSESLEVALFEEASVPWEQIAFPTVKKTLRHYFRDRRAGLFELHVEDIAGPK